jgi:DNA-binding Lrp family transcriptional regulator
LEKQPLDSLDLKILKELVRNNIMPFPSPALRKSLRTIGRNLRIDQGTVRNRIGRFKQNGLLKEFYLGVNPSLFGFKISALWFDVHPQSQKEKVKNEVSSLDRMLLVCDYLGSKLSAVFCYENERELKETTRRITRMANSENVVGQNKPFLPCDSSLKLGPSDWKIINALQEGDPWKKSFSLVAREAGLSTKTVKKRIGMMVEEGAIYLLASVNLRSFEGYVPADLTVFYKSPEFRDKVVNAARDFLGEMLVFADVEDKHHGYFALAVPTIARIREIQGWAQKCDGVGNAHVEILQDILSLRRFYDEQVRAKVEVPLKVLA